MESVDIKKMKDLEDENRRLKKIFADLSLECQSLKEVIGKSLFDDKIFIMTFLNYIR